ncbi:hypothetical protein K443DRAFT_530421 [Laccaria amethystina LaAM-08-1]|uniref:Uncharacterized protein n=1 Tax=Laccaria amethystina LaAM-08-1 TaxID=1095629 RepID=A0A0C9X8Z0_9AGAR|nr:hypothetical protein K443DRAFT_530421 [Laccaria amethystina LaAM-08-1]
MNQHRYYYLLRCRVFSLFHLSLRGRRARKTSSVLLHDQLCPRLCPFQSPCIFFLPFPCSVIASHGNVGILTTPDGGLLKFHITQCVHVPVTLLTLQPTALARTMIQQPPSRSQTHSTATVSQQYKPCIQMSKLSELWVHLSQLLCQDNKRSTALHFASPTLFGDVINNSISDKTTEHPEILPSPSG